MTQTAYLAEQDYITSSLTQRGKLSSPVSTRSSSALTQRNLSSSPSPSIIRLFRRILVCAKERIELIEAVKGQLAFKSSFEFVPSNFKHSFREHGEPEHHLNQLLCRIIFMLMETESSSAETHLQQCLKFVEQRLPRLLLRRRWSVKLQHVQARENDQGEYIRATQRFHQRPVYS